MSYFLLILPFAIEIVGCAFFTEFRGAELGDSFFDRAEWFLSEVRAHRYPSASDIAREFKVSNKTATRLIRRLKNDFTAPLVYNHAHRGYELKDSEFDLPCHCSLRHQELRALGRAFDLLVDNGKKKEAQTIEALLKRMGYVRYDPSWLRIF